MPLHPPVYRDAANPDITRQITGYAAWHRADVPPPEITPRGTDVQTSCGCPVEDDVEASFRFVKLELLETSF
jgi:hypothetical protein